MAHLYFLGGHRACAPPVPKCYAADAANGKPKETRGRCARCAAASGADWFRTARQQIAALGSFDRHWLHRSGIMAQTPPGQIPGAILGDRDAPRAAWLALFSGSLNRLSGQSPYHELGAKLCSVAGRINRRTIRIIPMQHRRVSFPLACTETCCWHHISNSSMRFGSRNIRTTISGLATRSRCRHRAGLFIV
jgi:hypothetical protein